MESALRGEFLVRAVFRGGDDRLRHDRHRRFDDEHVVSKARHAERPAQRDRERRREQEAEDHRDA